ncbi:substrate-binding domain-containing protein [Hydrogenoanaerobacterium sp.]|uniref:substrate-binding domain-containing protein n=1 Tax=Hydrogenoanaerobacterium sp. TaxID=2953763 RepID=UPI0028A21D95|nr:substrate-binding domain-containing protein [Hydrogenoanaerobacterium sp.]
MKKVVSILMAAAILLSATACGSAPSSASAPAGSSSAASSAESTPAASGEGPTLAFICKDLSQEWFVGTSTAMLETAKERGAKDVIMLDCAMSPDKYMNALDTAISQKVDVLIVCPPDQKLSQITVDRCKEAGIKVMADDDGLINEDGVHIAPALELDAYKVGEGIGEYLAKYVMDNKINDDYSKVGYICMTMSEVSSCVPRSEGALDKFKALTPDFPENKIIKADYDGTTDKGFNVAAATITANPDIKTWLVTAPNDEGAQGATRALEQAGLDKDAIVIGVGGYLAKDEFKKEYSCFKATAYIDPKLDGKLAANAAMDWIEEGKVPYDEFKKDGSEFGVYPFSATMVDATNYKEVMRGDAD